MHERVINLFNLYFKNCRFKMIFNMKKADEKKFKLIVFRNNYNILSNFINVWKLKTNFELKSKNFVNLFLKL